MEPSDPADWGGTVIKLYFHYCNTELLKKVKNIIVLFTSVHDTLKTWLGDGMISAVYHPPVTSNHTNAPFTFCNKENLFEIRGEISSNNLSPWQILSHFQSDNVQINPQPPTTPTGSQK